MSYLLDTNVISEIRKGERGNRAVAQWFEGVADGDLFLSVMVIAEIRKGIEILRRTNEAAAREIEHWQRRICRQFERRIIPVDLDVAEEWARLSVIDPPPVVDGLLAATAMAKGLTLVTRNTADIERTGVEYLDPFV